jgi:CheY-like chemotaxis protein
VNRGCNPAGRLTRSARGALFFAACAFSPQLLATQAPAVVQPPLPLSSEEQHYLSEKGEISFCIDTDWMPFEAIRTVEDGQQAVDQVNQHHFDLVLMDMQMPLVDGIKATRILRQQGHTLPIVALTANVMQRHRDAFYAAGCDGFLGKPIDKRELVKLLKQLLPAVPQQPPIPAAAEAEVDDELMQLFI